MVYQYNQYNQGTPSSKLQINSGALQIDTEKSATGLIVLPSRRKFSRYFYIIKLFPVSKKKEKKKKTNNIKNKTDFSFILK